MLTSLSIRDVVLIERLDLAFGPGLSVLTGETGAGKSILLDSLGLALGARSDAGLVRAGAEQASVSAGFAPAPSHPVFAALEELGLPRDDDVVLRRAVARDGRSRAWVNDAPVGAATLKRLGALLVEVQGQHDQMGLADPASHLRLLDAYGISPDLRAEVAARYRAWRAAVERLAEAEANILEAKREEEFLRHASQELAKLAPREGEEDELAALRHRLQQGEKRSEAIAAALSELTPRDRRKDGPAAALRAAARALQRLLPVGGEAENPANAALAALERAEEALAEGESLLSRLAAEADADPRALEQAEERLFGLRGAARKYSVAVVELPGLLAGFRARLAALDSGDAAVAGTDARSGGFARPFRGGGREAQRGAQRGGLRAGGGGQCRTAALAPRAREILRRGHTARGGGLECRRRGHRALPDRHQPRPAARPARARGLRRRIVAADAGAESGSGERIRRIHPGIRRGG